MSTELTSPLSRVLRAAAKLPRETGETAFHRERGAGRDALAILADVSGSMQKTVGDRRRVDILADALARTRPELPGARLIAFANLPLELGPGDPLPSPAGSTALHLAIEDARRRRPGRLLVITDGEPDNEEAALAAAAALGVTVDAIYCGDDDNRAALDFLRRLTAPRGGRMIRADLAHDRGALLPALRRLALPGPR